MKYLAWGVGWIFRLLGNITNDYALAAILFMVIYCFIYSVAQLASSGIGYKNGVLQKYISQTQQKFLVKDKELNDDCSLEMYKATKIFPLITVITSIILYLSILMFIHALRHPLSFFYGLDSSVISQLTDTVIKATGNASEFEVIRYIQNNPDLFVGMGLESIMTSNFSLFGINFMDPVSFSNFSFIIPILVIIASVIRLIQGIIKIIKEHRWPTFGETLVYGLTLLAIVSLAGTAFILPIVYHVYYLIFRIVYFLSNIFFKKIIKPKLEVKCLALEKNLKKIFERYEKKFNQKHNEPTIEI